jgi:CheY-like chemotaxis protein
VSPRDAPQASVPPTASSREKPEVLIAEDDLALLDVMERQLQQAGLFVRHATTGEQAIALVRGRVPSLLVLDVSLPRGDAFDVIEVLRRDPLLADLPVLVYTVSDLTVEQRERLTLGPTRFLTKTRSTDREFCDQVMAMVGHPAGVAKES